MLKYSEFKFPYKYFHLNFEFVPTGYFKQLDWEFLCFHLNSVATEFNVQVQALVMMDTHVHVLFRISDSSENFFSAALLKKIGVSELSENFVEPIRHQTQYLNTYRYIYRNPLEAGLVLKCEDYTYSSLSGLIGKSTLKINVYDRLAVIQNPMKILNWLNKNNQVLKYSQLKDLRQPSSVSI